MTTGRVVRAWSQDGFANLIVSVAEGGIGGNVEYHAKIPLGDISDLTAAGQKAALVAAVKKMRGDQVDSTPVDLPITGTVTL